MWIKEWNLKDNEYTSRVIGTHENTVSSLVLSND